MYAIYDTLDGSIIRVYDRVRMAWFVRSEAWVRLKSYGYAVRML